MSATVNEKHRELGKAVADEWMKIDYDDLSIECRELDKGIAQAIADAEARGREAGILDSSALFGHDSTLHSKTARDRILALLQPETKR